MSARTVRSIPVASTFPYPNRIVTMGCAATAATTAIGSITNSIMRSDRPSSETKSPVAPDAWRSLRAGSATIPSGTPSVPMGIWKTVNAIVNALIEPAARLDAIVVAARSCSWAPPRPIARGTSSRIVVRASGSARSTRG